jgi:hypothetical protein
MSTITVYSIDELSCEAKEKALSEIRSSYEPAWMNEYFESMKQGIDAFGFTLKNWRIDYSCAARSHVSVKSDHTDEINELTGVRLRTFILNNFYHVLFERKKYVMKTTSYKKDGFGNTIPDKSEKRRISKIFFKETCCPFTGYCGDEDFLDPIREFILDPCKYTTLPDLIESCIEEVLESMENDYDNQMSDEYLTEYAEVNGYQFTENGKRI